MNGFKLKIKSIEWSVVFVPEDTEFLNGELAITNTRMAIIFIADNISAAMLETVFLHEITHAILYSNLLVVPNKFTEEEVCNFSAQYLDDLIEYRNSLRLFLTAINKKEEEEESTNE